MPGYKIDVDFDTDFFNICFTKSQKVPKVTPAWKVRLAPKLGPPKAKALEASKNSTYKPPPRPKINATRFPVLSDDQTPRITDVTETEKAKEKEKVPAKRALQSTSGNPSRKIPKLQEKGADKAKPAPFAAKPSKGTKNSAIPQVNGAQ
jgi:hypothetical protein